MSEWQKAPGRGNAIFYRKLAGELSQLGVNADQQAWKINGWFNIWTISR